MTFNEFLKTLNDFDVSDLTLEQLELLKKCLFVKNGCINYYTRIEQMKRDSKKHED